VIRRGGQARASTTWRTLVRELSAFGVVGACCFVLDIGLFQLLYAQLDADAVSAKLVSTLASVTVGFFAHRYWSFAHRARTGVRREYSLFVAVNGATLLLSLAVVWVVRYPLDQTSALVLQLANVASIAAGTAIRFLSYRRWVFVRHDHAAARDARARRLGPAGTDRTADSVAA
jgi:putative flippase GtrA